MEYNTIKFLERQEDSPDAGRNRAVLPVQLVQE
jgi:hypothetical protein